METNQREDLDQFDARSEKITWGEFKKLLGEAGVKDDDEIDGIDVSWGNTDEFVCYKDEDFGWIVRL